MNDLANQLLGFLIGILSSFVFWYFMLRLKPNIAISPIVAFSRSEKKARVKVFNMGRRQATSISATLTVSELQAKGDRHYTVNLYTIPLKTETLFALGPKKNYGIPWSLYPSFTFVSSENEDILSMLNSGVGYERRLVFTFEAADALSGTMVVQRVSYTLKDIRFGVFALGLPFTVVEEDSAIS